MIRIFYIICFYTLFFPTIIFAQNTTESKITKEMISEYVSETNTVNEELSLERYKKWIALYLNSESELEINSTIIFENKDPVTTRITLNQNQFLTAATSETELTKSYKISNANIDTMKIFKNGKSAIISRSYDFERSTKISWKPVISIGSMNCQELLIIDSWTSKVTLARSSCDVKETMKIIK